MWRHGRALAANGLDATRAFRAMPGVGANLPLVALTSLNTVKMEPLALLARSRLVDAALGDQVHQNDDDKESNNDAGRSQGHRGPSG